jgi:hypothetical protein
MSNVMPNDHSKSGLERHVQTVLVALAITLMAWVGYSINQLTTQVVRLDEKLTASQSMATLRDTRIQRHEEDIQDLKLRVDRLERPE